MTLKLNTKVSFGLETSWGTLSTPSVMIPVTSVNDRDIYGAIKDDGLRGIAAQDFASYQDVGHSEISLEGAVYPQEIGYFLKLILGAGSVAGAGDPYTHSFTLSSAPQSLSMEVGGYPATNGRRYLGMTLSELVLKFNAAENFLTYTANFIGKPGAAQALTVTTDSTSNPFRGWMATANYGSTPAVYTSKITQATLTFRRVGTKAFFAAANTQVPSRVDIGPLEYTFDMVVDASALLEITWYAAHTQQYFDWIFAYGTAASAGYKLLKISGTLMDFSDEPLEIDRGDINVMYHIRGRGIYNATDSSSVLVSLQNSKSTYAS